ncbi:MAG: glycosyltransferase family 2 protein [Patescibacteria group bacterium]|nr:glycosyltransferase family 2 protein [Patescibacteria group bacterium]
MKLSIIIPVFNEENTIAKILEKVQQASSLNYEKEIIIIDDGSSDRTLTILKTLKNQLPLRLIHHSKNLGKGRAIRTALNKAEGSLILIQDADLEYDPEDYKVLLRSRNKDTPVVYGSRNLKPKQEGYLCCSLGVQILTGITNLLFRAKLTDIYTCYKLLPLTLARSLNLRTNGFEIEAEITAKILKRGIKIKEIPIHYYPRTFAQGKKIRFQDGLKGLWTILKCRL